MNFEQKSSMIFSDIDVPEVFINEYIGNANGDYVKIYLYCLFLCKYNCEITPLNLSKKLSLPISTIEEGIKYWEKNNVIIKKQNSYMLVDLKQQAVDKIYRLKATSSLDDAIKKTTKNTIRTQAIGAINAMFFQGVMSPTWYTDIDMLFAKYHFDEEVMIALFQYCYDRKALHRNYMLAVADAWAQNGIKTIKELDEYYSNYENLAQIKKTISRKLGISRKLSQYEEAYIDKWVMDFNYPLDVIEIALKKTTSKTNPSFDYIDKIISDWHEKKLTNANEVITFMQDERQKRKEFKAQIVNNNVTPIQKYTDTQTTQFNDLSKFYMN
jgi:DnaD/phage-associated family protein